MPRVKELELRPLGWENDPEEERFKLSTLDYLSSTTWTNFSVFFKLEDAEKAKSLTVLQAGLERTLSQVRHIVGTIEKDGDDQHSIVKRRHSTVKFVIQYFDSADEDTIPSLPEISKANFTTASLGDIKIFSNALMTCGDKPEAHPDRSPAISSFKASFIPGGLVLNIHMHHFCNGIAGWTSFVQQLAGNCYAITHTTEFPFFDPNALHRSFFGSLGFDAPSTSNEPQVEAPPRAEINSQNRPSQSLIFHLRKSKADELKKAVLPIDSRVSTYNAICALMWRTFSKIRTPLYKPDPAFKPIWGTGVGIAKQFSNGKAPIPAQIQGNLQFDIKSTTSTVPQLTIAEVVSEAPLSKLASYTREMAQSVTTDMLTSALQQFAAIRNKQDLSIRVDSFPPMTLYITDWRVAKICTFDFGFGKPIAFRHLFDGVPPGHAIVYPPRQGPAGDDEGIELQCTFEEELVQQLLSDPEWNMYFDFRGVDMWGEGGVRNHRAKL